MARDYSTWGYMGSGYGERVYLEVLHSYTDPVANRSTYWYKIWNDSNNSYGDTGSISWRISDPWNNSRVSGSLGNTPTTGYNQVRDYSTGSFSIYHYEDGTMPNINFVLHISRSLGNKQSTTVTVNVGTPNIDRAAPSISTSLRSASSNSLVIRMSSNNDNLMQTGYQIEGQGWVYGGGLSNGVSIKDFTIGSLTPNKDYRIRTYAQRRHNEVSGYSGYSTFKTRAVAPSTPSVNFTSIGTTSVSISASATAGSNSPIRAYRFYCSKTGWSGWQTGSTYTFTGLSANTSYQFSAQARTDGDLASGNTNYTQMTDSNPPSFSTSASVRNITTNSIEMVAGNVSTQIGVKEYRWFRNGTHITTTTSNVYKFTGLSPFTTYTLAVSVYDNKNRTAQQSTSGKTKATPINGASLVVTSINQSTAKLTASATAQAGIARYEYSIDGGSTYTQRASNTFDTSVRPGVTYKFRVKITDNEGNQVAADAEARSHYSDPIAYISSITEITPFTAKVNVSSSSQGPVSQYRYKIGTGSWTTLNGNPSSFILSGLEPNTAYDIEYQVKNSDNYWSASARSSFRTLEDKWLWYCKPNGEYVKANAYIVYSDGTIKKIEKSKRHIIR